MKTPVYRLLDEMPYEEFLGWLDYFDRRPVDWRDDDRTYKLLQVQGFKGKGDSIFPSLAALNRKPIKEDGQLDINNLKKSFLFSQLLTAKGGDVINYD